MSPKNTETKSPWAVLGGILAALAATLAYLKIEIPCNLFANCQPTFTFTYAGIGKPVYEVAEGCVMLTEPVPACRLSRLPSMPLITLVQILAAQWMCMLKKLIKPVSIWAAGIISAWNTEHRSSCNYPPSNLRFYRAEGGN